MKKWVNSSRKLTQKSFFVRNASFLLTSGSAPISPTFRLKEPWILRRHARSSAPHDVKLVLMNLSGPLLWRGRGCYGVPDWQARRHRYGAEQMSVSLEATSCSSSNRSRAPLPASHFTAFVIVRMGGTKGFAHLACIRTAMRTDEKSLTGVGQLVCSGHRIRTGSAARGIPTR